MANELWTSEAPFKADAGDAYYFVRRKDRDEVVVMGFSMGQAWLNGGNTPRNGLPAATVPATWRVL